MLAYMLIRTVNYIPFSESFTLARSLLNTMYKQNNDRTSKHQSTHNTYSVIKSTSFVKVLIRLRTSEGFLTMTMFPFAIANWFGVPVARAACGTTVGVGDVTAGWATAPLVVGCAALASCTRLPLMLSTEIKNMIIRKYHHSILF